MKQQNRRQRAKPTKKRNDTALVPPMLVRTSLVSGSAMRPGGYPPRYVTRLAYDENVVLTPTVAGALSSAYLFALNGLYDPNVTGVGVQPTGFDQLCPTVYAYFRVTEVVYDLVVTNTLATTDEVALLASVAYTSPVATDYRVAKTQPNTTVVNMGSASGGSGVVRLRRKVNIAQELGLRREEYNNSPNTIGTNANDPVWRLYLSLQSYSPTAVGTVRVQVQLEYRAEFFFRGYLIGS